jgi:glycosyltransferase involved in cell wall biosynthesis
MSNQKRKICYTLLNYRVATHRHYFHIYEFIEALGQKADVRLHVMEAEEKPDFKSPTAVLDLSGKGIKARLHTCRAILQARFKGYSIFYHHYTTAPARFSALVNRLVGGRTYLWHCIVMEALDDIVNTNRLKRFMLKLTFRMVHHLVTGTEYMADYYVQRYPLKRDSVKVIPNYINLDRFSRKSVDSSEIPEKLGIPRDKKIVLYLHEIEEGRASLLPNIVDGVLKDRQDTVFLIVGDGRYREELKGILQQRIDDGTVFLPGKVPNTQAPKYYGCADVFIMTSNFEAFSRVLLEAMAMGIPYVATDGGGNIPTYTPEIHQSWILPKDRWGEFPDKICELLDDSETRLKIVEAGVNHVQQYSLEKVVDTFLETII